MYIFEQLGLELGYVILSMIGVMVFMFLLIIILMAKQSKLNKRYKKLMSGATGENLESIIYEKFNNVEEVQKAIGVLNKKVIKIDETLSTTFQKVGIVKYDAFKEMGGKLSFALALLNNTNDGFVINSMHSSREGCYVYIKEIIKGESFVLLAEEEKEALSQAINKNNFME